MERRAVETLIHQHARTQELETSKDRNSNQIPQYTLEMQESCGRNAFEASCWNIWIIGGVDKNNGSRKLIGSSKEAWEEI